MLLKDFIRLGTERLEPLYPTSEARNIILMLCEDRIGTKSYTHLVEPERTIDDKSLELLEEDLGRLSSGEPIQYVTGSADFFGFKFKVTRDVLIPRPETELLCQEAIKIGSRKQRMRQAYGNSKPVRILDLCTGSGCIAWTMALSIPGAEVIATDISEKAIMVAMEQDFAALLKEKGALAPRFMIADVLGDDSQFDLGKFDLVLSNPPYIMESQKSQMRVNVLGFEPQVALFVPDEDPLLFYRAVSRWARNLLATEGWGFVEINELLGPETRKVFSEAGFHDCEIVKDYNEKNRFIVFSR